MEETRRERKLSYSSRERLGNDSGEMEVGLGLESRGEGKGRDEMRFDESKFSSKTSMRSFSPSPFAQANSVSPPEL